MLGMWNKAIKFHKTPIFIRKLFSDAQKWEEEIKSPVIARNVSLYTIWISLLATLLTVLLWEFALPKCESIWGALESERRLLRMQLLWNSQFLKESQKSSFSLSFNSSIFTLSSSCLCKSLNYNHFHRTNVKFIPQ